MVSITNFAHKVSFGKINDDYKNPDIRTREGIRMHLTKSLGTGFEYQEEIGNMSVGEAKAFIARQGIVPNIRYKNEHPEKETKKEVHVDVQALRQKVKPNPKFFNPRPWDNQEHGLIEGFNEIIPDKLYVGQALGAKPEVAKLLKKSNINSVLFLLKNDIYYRENAQNAGLNYMELGEIGHGSLSPYNFDPIDKLVKQPELYSDSKAKDIQDLKEFIDIVNGKDENLPGPLYMGCSYVTKVTPRWCMLYKILKDQPKDQPLTPERVEDLSNFLNIIEYGKPERW